MSINYALRLFPALALGLNNGLRPQTKPINFNLNKKSSPELDSANAKIKAAQKRNELERLAQKQKG